MISCLSLTAPHHHAAVIVITCVMKVLGQQSNDGS